VSDADLVRRCLDGERECFTRLVERYEKVVYTLAIRMVGNTDDARDVVQASFVAAYERLADFDFHHRFFSWLYRIAVNNALKVLRRRRPTEPLAEDLVADDPHPGEVLDRERLVRRVHAALRELPADHRQVIVLRHFLEMSYREMAEVLGVAEKTVKSRLFTARRRLCDLLDPRGGGL
jgi:RNA polymerase sigma-70 factor (ECF subfamily)